MLCLCYLIVSILMTNYIDGGNLVLQSVENLRGTKLSIQARKLNAFENSLIAYIVERSSFTLKFISVPVQPTLCNIMWKLWMKRFETARVSIKRYIVRFGRSYLYLHSLLESSQNIIDKTLMQTTDLSITFTRFRKLAFLWLSLTLFASCFQFIHFQ